MPQASVHESWSSKSAFVLAAVGAAVGLGNIWRFPFIAGQNGGGAFVLVYIGLVLLLKAPSADQRDPARRNSHGPVPFRVRLVVQAEADANADFIGRKINHEDTKGAKEEKAEE